MYQGTRGAVSVALISLSVWGCSQQDAPPQKWQALEFLDADAEVADAETDSGQEPVPAADSGPAPEPSCATSDPSCDGVDDDCDGEIDEDFQTRCVFGVVALVCVDGAAFSQVCDDSSVCTVDSCGASGCQYIPISCNDGDACTADSCDPQLGCSNQPELGAACDDGNACTAGESCDAAGSCQPGTALDFDDHNPCTADACDPTLGVSHTPVPGVVCDDGDVCSLDDVCDAAGSCQAGAPPEIDDGDPCTADACDPVLGVSHEFALGAACDDGNACSQADVCAADGSCVGLPPPGMDDANPCTADSCDPATGSITHTQLELGASCSDGNACNGLELCQGQTELTVSNFARQTFLRLDSLDHAFDPTIVRLSDYGFGPGRRVRIYTVGRYTTPIVSQATGVFSSDTRLLGRAALVRVPGAIRSDAPALVTGVTPFDGQPTDIPEDFRTDEAGIELTIPQGASHLFLANADTFYSDNAGSVQVIVRALEPGCVAGEAPVVSDDNACTADACDAAAGVTHSPLEAGVACSVAGGATGGCDGAGACVACTAQPTLCD